METSKQKKRKHEQICRMFANQELPGLKGYKTITGNQFQNAALLLVNFKHVMKNNQSKAWIL